MYTLENTKMYAYAASAAEVLVGAPGRRASDTTLAAAVCARIRTDTDRITQQVHGSMANSNYDAAITASII
jgi:hypothetical protein